MNENTSSVDVVIPVYNGEHFVEHAIRSVIAQTHAPRKIIVVNDGSTDGTKRVIRELQKESAVPIVCLNKANGGLSSARNAGILAAESEYIAFLDADDEWCPDKLAEQLAVFQSSPFDNLGVVYCRYLIIDQEGDLAQHPIALPHPNMRGDVYSKLFMGNLIISSGSGVLIRRKCFGKVGLFDEALRASEDWDMWLRIAEFYQYDFVKDKDLVKIRMHDDNMQKDSVRMFNSTLIMYEKWSHRKNNVGRYHDLPARWAHSLAYQTVVKLPDHSYLEILQKGLSSHARRRIFRYSFGSIKLYLIAMIFWLALREMVPVIKKMGERLLSILGG